MLALCLTLSASMFLLGNVVLKRDLQEWKETIKWLWNIIKPFLSWRILLCYGLVWFIASGWTILGMFIFKGWLRDFCIAWQAFLWLPWTAEKTITIPIAIWLHKKWFPNHSTSQLDKMLEKEKRA